MRHLELWESFNEYYWKVSTPEANNFFRHKGKIEFTDRQIEIIKQHYAKNIKEFKLHISRTAIIVELSYNQFLKQNGSDAPESRFTMAPSHSEKWVRFFIYSFDDEWFRCIFPGYTINAEMIFNQFICNGFDGLIKFLDDLVAGKVEF